MQPFTHFAPISMETWSRILSAYGWVFLLALALAVTGFRSSRSRSGNLPQLLAQPSLSLASLPIFCWALVANHSWDKFAGNWCWTQPPGPEDYWIQGFENFLALCSLCCLQTALLAFRGRPSWSTSVERLARLAPVSAITATVLDTFFLLWAITPIL